MAAAASAGVLAATTVLAVEGRVVAGETTVLVAVNGLPTAVRLPLEVAMVAGTAWAAAGVAGVALVVRRVPVALTAIGAWAVARALSRVLKGAIDRPRPSLLLDEVVVRIGLPHDAGFPSSHAAIAAALAVVVGRAWPVARIPAALVAVAAGLGRLAVGVHLPLDVVAGWSLGALTGLAAVAVAGRQ